MENSHKALLTEVQWLSVGQAPVQLSHKLNQPLFNGNHFFSWKEQLTNYGYSDEYLADIFHKGSELLFTVSMCSQWSNLSFSGKNDDFGKLVSITMNLFPSS